MRQFKILKGCARGRKRQRENYKEFLRVEAENKKHRIREGIHRILLRLN